MVLEYFRLLPLRAQLVRSRITGSEKSLPTSANHFIWISSEKGTRRSATACLSAVDMLGQVLVRSMRAKTIRISSLRRLVVRYELLYFSGALNSYKNQIVVEWVLHYHRHGVRFPLCCLPAIRLAAHRRGAGPASEMPLPVRTEMLAVHKRV